MLGVKNYRTAGKQDRSFRTTKQELWTFAIIVNWRVLLLQLNVATWFCCFSAGVLSFLTSYNALGGCLTVRSMGDHGSARMSSLRVYAAATT